jgi:hypothetical protein
VALALLRRLRHLHHLLLLLLRATCCSANPLAPGLHAQRLQLPLQL